MSLAPGQSMVYYTGFLSIDREVPYKADNVVNKRLRANAKDLRTMTDLAMVYGTDKNVPVNPDAKVKDQVLGYGLGLLTQRRVGKLGFGKFEYMITRRLPSKLRVAA